MKKTLSIILTNRTNYSKLRPIAVKLKKENIFNINFLISSASIIKKYGTIKNEIEKDGFNIECFDNLLLNDSHSAMGISFGVSSIHHSNYFSKNITDILLVVGDRYDTLAAVLCAKFSNIPIIHIQGGESSGSIDNVVRDLISRCANTHFVSTENSKKKLISMGINKNDIFNYGCPAVEEFVNICNRKSSIKDLSFFTKKKPLLREKEPYFVVLMHPDTTNEKDYLNNVLFVLEKYNHKVFLFYPNIDANNAKMLSTMQSKLNNENFFIIKHLRFEDFVTLLKFSLCFIGNSSSGIRESASLGIPFINVGDRQIGREQNKNTISCSDNISSIKKALDRALNNFQFNNENIYYKKHTSELTAKKIINLYG